MRFFHKLGEEASLHLEVHSHLKRANFPETFFSEWKGYILEPSKTLLRQEEGEVLSRWLLVQAGRAVSAPARDAGSRE